MSRKTTKKKFVHKGLTYTIQRYSITFGKKVEDLLDQKAGKKQFVRAEGCLGPPVAVLTAKGPLSSSPPPLQPLWALQQRSIYTWKPTFPLFLHCQNCLQALPNQRQSASNWRLCRKWRTSEGFFPDGWRILRIPGGSLGRRAQWEALRSSRWPPEWGGQRGRAGKSRRGRQIAQKKGRDPVGSKEFE